MKLLACGGRNYVIQDTVDTVLRRYLVPFDSGSIIITGGARGADELARLWGLKNGIHVAVLHALWDIHGLSAGPMRNRAMLELGPELVIAFPGGNGTENMVKEAERRGVPVMRVADAVSSPRESGKPDA